MIILPQDELDKANKDKKRRYPPNFQVCPHIYIYAYVRIQLLYHSEARCEANVYAYLCEHFNLLKFIPIYLCHVFASVYKFVCLGVLSLSVNYTPYTPIPQYLASCF